MIKDSGPDGMFREMLGWDTILCVGTGRPVSIPAFQSKYFGTSHVGMGWDVNASRFMKKLEQSNSMRFKILVMIIYRI